MLVFRVTAQSRRGCAESLSDIETPRRTKGRGAKEAERVEDRRGNLIENPPVSDGTGPIWSE
jgi:hypothetical protein